MTLERHAAVVAEDLPCIYVFIARDNPAAAERVLDAIELTFERLLRQPDSGVRYRSGDPRLVGLRMLPVIGFENYLTFYKVENEIVRILYVLHGAQHLRRAVESGRDGLITAKSSLFSGNTVRRLDNV